MKFSTVLSLALAAAVSGQSISDIPQCALTCFLGPLQSDGCKGLTDFKCHCSNPKLIPEVTPCVAKACPPDVAQQVQEKAVALCKANGVDITIPGSGSSTAAPPAGTASSPPIVTSESASAYPTGSAPTMSTYPAPSGNGSSPTAYPPPPPTGAASKATFGGAVAVAAGVAALAGF